MTELLTEVAAANQQATEELQAAQQKAKEAEEEVRAAMAITDGWWHAVAAGCVRLAWVSFGSTRH